MKTGRIRVKPVNSQPDIRYILMQQPIVLYPVIQLSAAKNETSFPVENEHSR